MEFEEHHYIIALTRTARKSGETPMDLALRLRGIEGVVINSPTPDEWDGLPAHSTMNITYRWPASQLNALLGDYASKVIVEKEISHKFVD